MQLGSTFSEILQTSLKVCLASLGEESLFSLALPLKSVDPLIKLPLLTDQDEFSFLWDSTPGICIAASGKCQSFELVGQSRFQSAQSFTNQTLDRIIDGSPEAPLQSKARVFLGFTFFEQTTQIRRDPKALPGVQAVLPRWQLTKQSGQTWLRLNALVTNQADVRCFVEQIWLMRQKLLEDSQNTIFLKNNVQLLVPTFHNWKHSYRLALAKGIDLVNAGELKKLVLAVRQRFQLLEPIEPLQILLELRKSQRGSCRFLWKRCKEEAFFGASPERLLSFRKGHITIDALAGTARSDGDGSILLNSEKDLREHELVVVAIKNKLLSEGLEPHLPRQPRLAKHGHLIHLHTPIVSSCKDKSPLQLVDALHPTPAVAGFPVNKAIKWLRTLEPFDRGAYAAPIGWIDDLGNAEFRVAIRCAYASGNTLDLIAGAGLVKGSVIEAEFQEVLLKLDVLSAQLSNCDNQENFSKRRSIT